MRQISYAILYLTRLTAATSWVAPWHRSWHPVS